MNNIARYWVVYFHRNSQTNEVFYVGNGRASRPRCFVGRSDRWNEYVSKHGLPVVEIVQKDLTKDEANDLETRLISQFGRLFDNTGSLLNFHKGGEGAPIKYFGNGAPTSIRVPDDVMDYLMKISEEEDRSIHYVIMRILRAAVINKFGSNFNENILAL